MALTIAHVAIHGGANTNAGDTALVEATKNLFESRFRSISWINIPLWNTFSAKDCDQVNQTCDLVLIGGGGLFLVDQVGADSTISGWQWNCSEEQIDRIGVPIALFGVGYNRFRSQTEFPSQFRSNVQALLTRSSFFGLRNSGSIEAVKSYVDSASQGRIRLQPCPTTLTSALLHRPLKTDSRATNTRPRVALNLAFDRREMRFQRMAAQIKAAVTDMCSYVCATGVDLTVVCHKPGDAEASDWLNDAGIVHSVADLTSETLPSMAEFYVEMDLVIGMRGHAQLIPFGVGTPIISIISHEKMRWFLEDWGQSAWGVDVLDPNFAPRLLEAIHAGLEQLADRRSEIRDRQRVIWQLTQSNLDIIEDQL